MAIFVNTYDILQKLSQDKNVFSLRFTSPIRSPMITNFKSMTVNVLNVWLLNENSLNLEDYIKLEKCNIESYITSHHNVKLYGQVV